MTSITHMNGAGLVRSWRVLSKTAIAQAERARLEQQREKQRESEGVLAAAEAALRDAAMRQTHAAERATGAGELPTISVATVANAAFVKQVLELRLQEQRARTRLEETRQRESAAETPDADSQPARKEDSVDKLDTYA